MDSQQRLVEQLFAAALERSPENRKAFLDQACAGMPGARRRVEDLLLEDERAGSFLNVPLIQSPGFRLKDAVMTEEASTLGDNTQGSREDVRRVRQPERFQPGQVIAERFTVVRFIARGGMGEVYEVDDRFLQHVHIALKVILPEIAEDAGSSYRFEQEVLLARSVTHPNLCPIYDISLCREPAPPFLFLTMKLLQGETLAARLRGASPIPRDEAVSIFRQLVAGLAAIHAGGVVHRDIKPNNVMLDESNGELCLSIMDFGLARLHESETTGIAQGRVAGTPGYLAPELFLGHRPSQASDIYALGVLLHQVFTGAQPSSRADSLAAEPSSALAVADVPRTLMRAVEEFLSADPKRRCDAFKEAQGDASATEQVLRSSASHRTFLTRRRLVMGSALAASAAAVGAAAAPEPLNGWLDGWLHPLPLKRFVALLNWLSPDARLKPMLLGVIDAIAGELSRAEAFDHNLFVIAEEKASDLKTQIQMDEAREALGANLVLAAFATPRGKDIHLSLRVFDPPSPHPIREKEISVPVDEQSTLPEKAVRAAARLLDVSSYSPEDRLNRAGTDSLEALAAFQSAEALAKRPNETGLDAAIEKYKEAIDLDPHYARAYARLALTYIVAYREHGDEAAISLSRANAQSALQLDPRSVDAHVAMAWILQSTGNQAAALRSVAKALSLDPSDAHTLVCQARIYALGEDWSRAEATFARVLAMRPNYWLAHNELGVVLYEQYKYTQALTEFQLASAASPKDAYALANLGSLYLQIGKLQDALENTRKSFDLNPTEDAAMTLASIYRVRKEYAYAIVFAEKAIQLAPKETVNWVELGDCYAATGTHNAEAATAYRRAAQVQEQRMRTDPGSGPGWMLLALSRAKAQRRDGVAALVQKAETLKASDVSSQLCKARTLELLGLRAEALSTIAHCLQKGATSSQVEYLPDLEKLRRDPQYRKSLSTAAS